MPPIKQERGRTKLSNMILITIGANAVKMEEPSLLASTTTAITSGRLLIKIRNKAQSFLQTLIPKLQYYYIDAMLQLQRIAPLITYFFLDHKYE